VVESGRQRQGPAKDYAIEEAPAGAVSIFSDEIQKIRIGVLPEEQYYAAPGLIYGQSLQGSLQCREEHGPQGLDPGVVDQGIVVMSPGDEHGLSSGLGHLCRIVALPGQDDPPLLDRQGLKDLVRIHEP